MAPTLPTLLLLALAIPEQVARDPSPVSNGTTSWSGREAEIEAFLETAEIERMEEIGAGITRPMRCYFRHPGPARSMAWKPIRPGRYRGHQESYKSEIAAYALDRLLGLGRVPPTVERRLNGRTGAAVMWVDDVKGWSVADPVRGPNAVAWTRELARMQMFDQLIANIDRNQGNLLYDEAFNLILIDHSRAFTTTTDLSKMARITHVDRDLWRAVEALTADTLEASLGKWLSDGAIRAILRRRDKIREDIDALLAVRGEASVFLPR